MRLVEIFAFVGLATGAHLGVWALSPTMTGSDAAGGQGRAVSATQAATPEQMRLVAAWDRPPETGSTVRLIALAPPVVIEAPALPQADLSRMPDLMSPARLALHAPAADLPRMDVSPPPQLTPPRDRLRPKPRPASLEKPPAERDQAASGAAQQKIKGRQGTAKTQSQDAARSNALRAQWGARIYAKVQRNLIAPRGLYTAGTAKLALKVAASGRLQGLSLVRSSGNADLDRAALQAIKRAGSFDRAPAGLAGATHDFSLSLTFTR
jgi:protein TonB